MNLVAKENSIKRTLAVVDPDWEERFEGEGFKVRFS